MHLSSRAFECVELNMVSTVIGREGDCVTITATWYRIPQMCDTKMNPDIPTECHLQVEFTKLVYPKH